MMDPLSPASSAPLHEVITFYSYKGGTGRTMALANVACLFAAGKEQPQRVLAIDWDLEAPGLHYYLRPPSAGLVGSAINGVVEYFTRVQEVLGEGVAEIKDQEAQAEDILARIPWAEFCHATSVPNVDLMPAGCMDSSYQTRLAKLDWPHMYQQAPGLFRCFARQLAKAYDVVLVDSRTGLTDISGICTSLLPDKLVVVFTANRQSLAGIENLVTSSVDYRQGSRDVRPLLVYPLPSRIDAERDKLRQLWRHGDSSLGIEGYQPQFERMFQSVYALEACTLSVYCDEVQVQHSPDYAYGEDVAAIHMQEADRFSIVRSYQALLRWIQASAAPWETPEMAEARSRLDGLLKEEAALIKDAAEAERSKDAAAPDWPRLARLQEEILMLACQQRGSLHQETIAIRERLIQTTLRFSDIRRTHALLRELANTLPELRMPVRVHAIGIVLRAAAILRSQHGQDATAEELKRDAIASLTADGVAPDPNSLSVLETVGNTLRETSALPEARALLETLAALQERVHGGENPATLTTLANLAETERAQGELPAARALQERVLEVTRRRLGEDDPATLTALANLAETLRGQGDLPAARAMQERVLEVRRRVLGDDHPDTLTSMANLAETLKAQGELPGVRALRERVLEVTRCRLGEDDPATLTALANLAETLKAQGELPGVRALQERVLEVRRRVLGEDHPATLAAMNQLAGTLLDTGDLEDAKALQQQMLDIQHKVLKISTDSSLSRDPSARRRET